MEEVDLGLRIVQVIVAGAGFWMVVKTLRQKDISDNRAEWWKRYIWAVEHISDTSPKIQEVAWLNLEVLSESPLATASEAELIQGLAESDETADNEDDPPEGQQ